MYQEAIVAYRKSHEISPAGPGIGGLGHVSAMSGMKEEAQTILDKLKRRVQNNQARPSVVAIVYAGLNDINRAFEWMDKTYEQFPEGVVYFNAQPYSDNLGSDPKARSVSAEHRLGVNP